MKCALFKSKMSPDRHVWVAICLDDYAAAQGDTAKEAKRQLVCIIRAKRWLGSSGRRAPREYRRGCYLERCHTFYITNKHLRTWKVVTK